MSRIKLGKYGSLILYIGVFISLILLILGLNAYISFGIAENAKAINLAGRQQVLLQDAAANLVDLKIIAREGGDIAAPLKALEFDSGLFGRTLIAFLSGGSTIGADRSQVSLERVDTRAGQTVLEESRMIWSAYRERIAGVLNEPPSSEWFTAIQEATRFSVNKSEELLNALRQVGEPSVAAGSPTAGSKVTQRRERLLRRIQGALVKLNSRSLNDQSASILLSDMQRAAIELDASLASVSQAPVGGPEAERARVRETGLPGGAQAARAKEGALETTLSMWNEYFALLAVITSQAENAEWFERVEDAAGYAREQGQAMSLLMESLTRDLQRSTEVQAERLRYVQIGAAALAVLFFTLMVFGFVRYLRASDAAALRARNEIENIMRTVREGLFLVDENLSIGTQYSAATADVFGTKALAGSSFKGLLSNMVSEKVLRVSENYVRLLLEGRVKGNLTRSVNPLRKVEVNVSGEDGSFQTKYLNFNFNQAINSDDRNVLVTVSDITERVRLESEIEALKENKHVEMDMLAQVIHVDRQSLVEYLKDTEAALRQINDLFREEKAPGHNLVDDANAVMRIIHRVKGEASALGLGSFEARAHEFEDLLTELREKRQLGGRDFLPATIKLDDLMSLHGAISAVAERLTRLPEAKSEPASIAPTPVVTAAPDIGQSEDLRLTERLASLAARISENQGKKVQVRHEGLDISKVPEPYRKAVGSMAVQLVRNAISHGIEIPEVREAANKNGTGLVKIAFASEDDGYTLAVLDNGRGIDFERLREKAVGSGRWTDDEVASWGQAKLANLLFVPGFSTASEVTRDAGRGVGMDIVKEIAEGLGGDVKIRSKLGIGFELRVHLPSIGASADVASGFDDAPIAASGGRG